MTMLRICAALAAALLLPGMAGAKELKPKFGNIDGVYYSDVAENREACRQAIRNKIALCRQNVDFESNTKNRKYKGCLPIFRRQAQSCVVHFRHQMSKCDGGGAARITDFTGFSCEATRTVVEDDGEPGISPLDRRMQARTRVNLRAGPGTDFRIVGSLRTGQEVRVTGRAGDWLRIGAPGGGTAFVHSSLLVGAEKQDRGVSTGRRTQPTGGPELARLKAKWNAAANRCWKYTDRIDERLHERQLCSIREYRHVYRTHGPNAVAKLCNAKYDPKVIVALRQADRMCCGPVRRSSASDRKTRGFSRLKSRCNKFTSHYRKWGWSW
ncbi:MAG: SH3 domain-containing protein [Rhodospirillaceae bacterium]|nr:SH3 domain-containing protein [Rhodospirillaceae bacterium]